jgi:hypothetical protein
MDRFVRYNRARIEEYVAFAGSCRKVLEAFAASHPDAPDLAPAIEDLAPLIRYDTDLFEESHGTIQTPEDCRRLAEQMLAWIDRADADALGRVQELGKAIRIIGGRQDDMLAGCRVAAKALRQRAGQIYAAAPSAAVRELMRDLRSRTRAILRICSPYEEFLFLTARDLLRKQ